MIVSIISKFKQCPRRTMAWKPAYSQAQTWWSRYTQLWFSFFDPGVWQVDSKVTVIGWCQNWTCERDEGKQRFWKRICWR